MRSPTLQLVFALALSLGLLPSTGLFATRTAPSTPTAQQDGAAGTGPRRSGSIAAAEYARTPLRGFDVRVAPGLLEGGDDAAVGARALDALERDLGDVLDQTPAQRHEFLRSVPIFLGVGDPVALCACYHPSARWLERNGFDPAKAKAVEIANARTFVDWRGRQPSMVLHELAHAFLDQVARAEQPRLEAALKRVRERGVYDRTLRWAGQVDRHYALTSVEEYFAETTEALLGVNDFYPFVRAELLAVDPDGAALVDELWGAGAPGTGEPDLVGLATREVQGLHAFFSDWFAGRLENDDEAFARLEGSLAPGFRKISPDGRIKGREAVLRDVRRGHGAVPDGSVSAGVLSVRRIDAVHLLVMYEERQVKSGGERRTLISTALLAREPRAPGGLVWHQLQETTRGAGR